MATIPTFDSWRKQFAGSQAAMMAFDELEEKFPAAQEGTQTPPSLRVRNVVLDSCYGAAMFAQSTDLHKGGRRADADSQAELPPHRKAVAALLRHIERKPKGSSAAFREAIRVLANDGIEIEDRKGRTPGELLHKILTAYTAELVGPLQQELSGPSHHRYTCGCLHYGLPLDDRKRKRVAGVKTMLVFDLVQTFRIRSANAEPREQGDAMPTFGEPYCHIAAAFVNATFPSNGFAMTTKMAEGRLKTLLTNNLGLGYVDWPAIA